MLLAHQPSKLLVTGCSGSGKTTYWARYLTGLVASPKFVFDHEGELSYRWRVRPAYRLPELVEGTAKGWCIFDPVEMFPGDTEAAFNFFCDFAFTASTRLPGRKLFACDELQKLVGTNQVSRELALVLETGRRYGIDAAMISQQPNLVHNRVRNQATEVVAFQQMDPLCIDWLSAVGFDGEAVRRLRPGEYLARNLKTRGQDSGRVF